MKILILTSYTNSQKYRPDNCIKRGDYSSPERLSARIKELCGYNAKGWYDEDGDYSAPAGEMFTGPSHKQVQAGLRQVRDHAAYGETTIDQYFLSTYFRVDGRDDLVCEDDCIVPFNIPPIHDSSNLGYRNTALWDHLEALMERYDLVFSLMEKYDVLPLIPLFEGWREVTLILLAAPSWNIPSPESLSSTHIFPAGACLVGKLDRASKHNLRGAVFRKLCEVACCEGSHIFEQIKQDPQQLLEIVQS